MPDTPTALPGQQPAWSLEPDLVRLAQIWPTTHDPEEVPTDLYAEIFPEVHRCADVACGQRIVPFDLQHKVIHLMRSHGYRMDGRAFDNDNRPTTTARRELEAMNAGS